MSECYEYPNSRDVNGLARYVVDRAFEGDWSAYGQVVDYVLGYGIDYLELNKEINRIVGEKIYPEGDEKKV
jgi:hypothetical protein